MRPGGTIVEATAGNTGLGLALVGGRKGYRTLLVVPDKMAREKVLHARAMGAEVRTVPEVPYSNPDNYIRVSERIAAETKDGFWANQFDNLANRLAHYQTTGPEIWEQTEHQVTAFVASIGTGGTLAGAGTFLKERNHRIKVVCADPYGAAMWSWFTLGHTEINDGESVAEGIGQNRVTKNLEGIEVDRAYRIPDPIGIEVVYHLLRREGLFVGMSSAINVCGALKVAKEGGKGQVITTLLCDSGARYLSRLFNTEWLKAKNLVPRATGLEFLSWL